MARPTKSLWEIISSVPVDAGPSPDDLVLIAPQPGTPYQSTCKAVKLSTIAGGGGGALPADEVAFGTGLGITSSPDFLFDGSSVLLLNDDGVSPLINYDSGDVTKNTIMATIPNNEANKGDFGWAVHRYAPNNGATRYDCVMQLGFNPTQSALHVAGDHSFNWTLENSYKTNGGVTQLEFYYEAAAAGGGFSCRPFGITWVFATNQIVPRFNCQAIYFDDETGANNPWLQIQSNDGGPTKYIYITDATAELRMSGTTNLNWLKQNGVGLIAFGGASTGYLFPDGGSVEKVVLTNREASNNDTSLIFGQTGNGRVITWDHTAGTFKVTDHGLATAAFWQAKYKSSDGSSGVSGTIDNTKTATVKDGIITAIV